MNDKLLQSGEFDKRNYSHCLFRIPKDGGRVIWEITNRCNYNCSYCIFSSQNNAKDELNTDEVFRTISDLKKSGFKYLKITGGEPFTRSDMADILGYAQRLGFSIDISTNASLFTDEIVKRIKKLNLDMIHVGFDGHTKEIVDLVRGRGSFDSSSRGIRKLTSAGIYVRIGCLIFNKNEQYLEDIIKYCTGLNVREVIFSLMEPVGRMRNNNSLITKIPPASFIKILTKLREKYRNKIKVNYSFASKINKKSAGECPGPCKFLSIDSKGKIAPCTWIAEYFPQYISKNTLHDFSLKQILKTPEIKLYKNLANKLPELGLSGCPMQDRKIVKSIIEIDSLFTPDLEINIRKNISDKGKFSSYSQLYSFTTENIAGYFKHFDFKEKKVLTVGGSGDHMINAYLSGAKEVVCFDINILAGYYTELKIAALKKLDYDTFLSFFMRPDSVNINTFSYKTYLMLENELSIPAKYFFNTLYKYFKNNGCKIRESLLFNNEYDEKTKKIINNLYLANENIYNKTKNILINTKFKWYANSIEELCSGKVLKNKKFDLILLSNISDYSHKMFNTGEYLSEYKLKIIEPLLKHVSDNGKLQFAYLYNYNKGSNGNYRNNIDNEKQRKMIFNIKGAKYREHIFKGIIENNDAIAYLNL